MAGRDWPRSSEAALLASCALCIGFGVYLRAQELAFPAHLTFDEHHFVQNAHNYLAGEADWNDHPPLGKLLIAIGIMAFGQQTPFGFRSAALVFGLLSIGVAYALGRRLFRAPATGLLAAAFVAVDGMLIAYSRTALLDGMLTACALLAVLPIARRASLPRALGSGIGVGLATSIKLSGVGLLLPLGLACIWDRPAPRRALALLGTAAAGALATYYGQYGLGLALSGKPGDPLAVVDATTAMIAHHAALDQMQHQLVSRYYAWVIPTKPVMMRHAFTPEGWVRVMVALGNPLLWWSSWAAVLATISHGVWRLLRRGDPRPPRDHEPQRGLVLACAAWGGLLLPWVVTSRDSYLYHYLPCYGFALVILAALTARLQQRRPLLALLGVLAIALVSAFYAPVWAQLPLSKEAIGWRLFLTYWS